jgi:hypothetical protein
MGGVAVVKRCMPCASSREGCTPLDAAGCMEKCVGDSRDDFGMGWKRRLDKSLVDGEKGRMCDFSEGGGQRRGVDALLAMLGLWRKRYKVK